MYTYIYVCNRCKNRFHFEMSNFVYALYRSTDVAPFNCLSYPLNLNTPSPLFKPFPWVLLQRDASKLAVIERWVYVINGGAFLCGIGISLMFLLSESTGNYRDLYCMVKPGFFLHASYLTVSAFDSNFELSNFQISISVLYGQAGGSSFYIIQTSNFSDIQTLKDQRRLFQSCLFDTVSY